MKDEAHQQNKLALCSFRLIIPAVVIILTWLGFNAILHYYAPYGRFITLPVTKLGEPINLVTAVEVWDETSLTQPFVAAANGLARLDFQVATWGDRPRPHNVFWQLSEIGNDGTKIFKRNGKFRAINVEDWEFVSLKFQPIADSTCKHYEVSFSAPGTPQAESIGFPIFKTQEPPSPEAMSRIILGTLKDTEVDLQGSLRGSNSYFYEKFG